MAHNGILHCPQNKALEQKEKVQAKSVLGAKGF